MEEAPTKVTRLPNGLTVITSYQPTEQAHVALDVSVGARYENAKQAGISHFIEHMLLKKTKDWDIKQQAEKVRDAYGYMNAITSLENTQYYYHVNKAYVPQMIKMLADSMLRAEMTPESVKNEANTIFQELIYRSSQGNNSAMYGETIASLIYPSDSRLATDIAGTYQTISSFTVSDLQQFVKQHYTADRMRLIVVGPVKHEDIVRMAEKEFGELPKGAGPVEFPTIVPRQGYKTVNNPDMDQIMFGMAFPIGGTRQGLQETYKSILLSIILSGDLASPLYENLRNQKGAVYAASARTAQFLDSGNFIVEASSNAANAKALVSGIAEELKKADHYITPKMVEQAKKVLLGDYERLYENSTDAALSLANQMRNYGKLIPLAEVRQMLATITPEDLKVHAQKLFSQAPAIAAYGNGADKIPSYEQITAMLGHRRYVGNDGLLIPEGKSSKWAGNKTGAKESSFSERALQEKAVSTQHNHNSGI